MRKERKAIEGDAQKLKQYDKFSETIDTLTQKLSENDDLQAKLGKSISQAGMDILAACKMRGAKLETGSHEPAEPVVTNSWNPDEPTPL